MDSQARNQGQNQKRQTASQGSPFSSQGTLPIATIRDGVVVLKDGSFRLAIKADAINFDLMSGEEKEAIEYSYQAFINSLYFPIQIQVQSRRIDAEIYLKKLEDNLYKQNNMLLSVLIEDYLDFITELVEESDIMSKDFHVIIPFFDDDLSLENVGQAGKNLFSKLFSSDGKKAASLSITEKDFLKAKKELSYYAQVVIDGLAGCGIRSRILNTEELIKMYYEFYNHDAGAAQNLRSFEDLNTPYVSSSSRLNPRLTTANEQATFEAPAATPPPVAPNQYPDNMAATDERREEKDERRF